MNNEKKIIVSLSFYGELREHTPRDEKILFELTKKITISALRELLIEKLKKSQKTFAKTALVRASAFANYTLILSDDHVIDECCELSVLPPVCGG